jgi:glyoxylase-like metal-dependent hydrolase (beta-lactamase superfamily II)
MIRSMPRALPRAALAAFASLALSFLASTPAAAADAAKADAPKAGATATAVDPRATIAAAVKAIGGEERVRSVRNITLIGYGEYAYQFGMANVTASPLAVMRSIAAHDMRRIYDLEHDRFRQLEYRNMNFTFALPSMTSWAPFNLNLDGDIAWDINPDGKAVRIGRWTSSAWFLEGPHMRRMWMVNNPVVALRRALDPATKLSNGHVEHGQAVVDLTLKEGDRFSMGFDPRTHLPAWVRWSNPHNNFGMLTFTTYLEGYVPTGGLLMPFSLNTKLDWRDVEYLRVHLDGYEVDTDIGDLAAPADVRNSPEPVAPLDKIEITQMAPHVWNLKFGAQATIAFEFDDHITLYELHRKPMAQALIDAAATLVPGKKATQVITSHGHSDHIAGVRVAVANGLTVITRRGNAPMIRDMIAHSAGEWPDALSKNPKPVNFILVDEHVRLSDKTNTVDIYWDRANSHMADGLFAYVPAAKIFVEADLATAARDYQYWADNFEDVIEFYKLDVVTLMPVHFGTPMTRAEANEFIRGGVQRARERCEQEKAKGNHHIGCPVISKRY